MKNGDKLESFLSSEILLDDDFPVYWDFLYIVDGRVFRSDVQGNIMTLKRDLFSRGLIPSLEVECRRLSHERFM